MIAMLREWLFNMGWPSAVISGHLKLVFICLYSPGPISSLKMSQAQEHTGTVKKHPRQIKGAAVFVAQLWKSRGFSSMPMPPIPWKYQRWSHEATEEAESNADAEAGEAGEADGEPVTNVSSLSSSWSTEEGRRLRRKKLSTTASESWKLSRKVWALGIWVVIWTWHGDTGTAWNTYDKTNMKTIWKHCITFAELEVVRIRMTWWYEVSINMDEVDEVGSSTWWSMWWSMMKCIEMHFWLMPSNAISIVPCALCPVPSFATLLHQWILSFRNFRSRSCASRRNSAAPWRVPSIWRPGRALKWWWNRWNVPRICIQIWLMRTERSGKMTWDDFVTSKLSWTFMNYLLALAGICAFIHLLTYLILPSRLIQN